MKNVHNFTAVESLVMENSYAIIDEENDVILEVTVGIHDEESGYFEIYDEKSGGERWYGEGQIEFDGMDVVGYNGVFDLPMCIKDKLVQLGYSIDQL